MERLKKRYSSILALMMAIVMTTVFMMPDLGIKAEAAGLEIVHATYYNGNPPKLAVKYKDPNNRTLVDLWVVSKTPENGDVKITINGQQYYGKISQLVSGSDIVDNGDGTKTIPMPADDKMKVLNTPAAGTSVTIWLKTYDSTNPSISDEVTVDITVPQKGKSTDDALTATPPVGETKYYQRGEWQVGVQEGAGYTLSRQFGAWEAGSYTATATLQSGYKWTDGTTAPKQITWELKPAEISGVTVHVSPKDDFSWTYEQSVVLYPEVTFANGDAGGSDFNFSWSVGSDTENVRVGTHKPGNYTLTVTGANSNVTGSATASYTITKGKGKFKATAKKKTPTIKKKTNKKKKVDIDDFISTKYGHDVTYKKISGDKNIKFNNDTGKIVLGKGLGPGTYTVKVKVTSKSDVYAYGKATQTVKIKIKVVDKKK